MRYLSNHQLLSTTLYVCYSLNTYSIFTIYVKPKVDKDREKPQGVIQ